MISRTLRGVVHVLGGIGAAMAIVLVLLAWRLSSGPISLAFLSPYIESALNELQGSTHIRLQDTILTWGGWRRSLDIHVIGVRIEDSNNAVIASVPELSVSISLNALVRGTLAVNSLDFIGPRIRLERRSDGKFEIGVGKNSKLSSLPFGLLTDRLTAAGDDSGITGYLKQINIVDATISIKDKTLDRRWRAVKAQATISRTVGGLRGKASLNIAGKGRVRPHLTVTGTYGATEKNGTIDISFKNIRPTLFSVINRDIGSLGILDLPLDGAVNISIRTDGAVDRAEFSLNGRDGHVALPVAMAQKFGMSSLAQRLAVNNFILKGRFKGAGNKTEIDLLSIDFAAATNIYIPSPVDHKIPIKSLTTRGIYLADTGRMKVIGFKADLGGPTIGASAVAHSDAKGALEIDLKGVMKDIPVDSLAVYWPRALGVDARKWSLAHLSGGRIRKIRAEIKIRAKPQTGTVPWNGLKVASIDGDMIIKGLTVDYLPPMPKMTGVNAKAVFNRKRFDIAISGGQAGGLNLNSGTISLTGLDKYDQFAKIRLSIVGPVRKALELIEHKPLGFASAVGIDPAGTSGNAATDMKLGFIIEKSLSRDQVKVSASSKLTGVGVDNAILGRPISNGQLTLEVNNRGMDVNGQINLGNIPATVDWRRNFALDAPFHDRYDISGSIADIGGLSDLGIDSGLVSDKFISGTVMAKARFTVRDKTTSHLDVEANLTDAALSVPMLMWTKKSGIKGTVQASVDIKGNLVAGIPSFSISAGNLQVEGSAAYSTVGGGLKSIKLRRFNLDKTDMSVLLTPGDDGSWTVRLSGSGFNLEPFFEDMFKDEPSVAGRAGIRLNIILKKLGRVWLGPGRFLKNVVGTMVRNGNSWREINVNGTDDNGKGFKVTLMASGKSKRKLLISAEDAGEILRIFDFYKNMSGGTLKLSGIFDDSTSASPLKGKLDIRDYRVVNATALAQLVSYLSLTGILESLQGDGLAFQSLEAPFSLSGGVLDITDAKAEGISLGYTASGKIYTNSRVVDIGGTVVPAYAINSALGNIPILGEILTGGEEGGGIFAANYKMTGSIEKPKVTVNPISVLAPGFLRNLFKVFGKNKKPPAIPYRRDRQRQGGHP